MPEKDMEPKKRLEQNIVWFSIGMVAAGAIGATAFHGFLNQRIDERIANMPGEIEASPEEVADELFRRHRDQLKGGDGKPGATAEQIIAELKSSYWEELQGLPGALLKNAVVSFDLRACPQGWEEYPEAYGRFIRGIDRKGKTDPEKNRLPGDLQNDAVEAHRHARPEGIYIGYGLPKAEGVKRGADLPYSHEDTPETGTNGENTETRPKNVALLFCRKN